MAFFKTEAHKVYEENEFSTNSKSIPLDGDESGEGKPHRFSFNIGCFNDGLRTNICKHLKYYKLLKVSRESYQRMMRLFSEFRKIKLIR